MKSFSASGKIKCDSTVRSTAPLEIAMAMLIGLVPWVAQASSKPTQVGQGKEWGAGILLNFPIVRNADFLSKMDIIPYFFLAPEETQMQGQDLSFVFEPKMVFRVDLRSGSLQSARFNVGTKAVIKDLHLESDPFIVVSSSGQAAVFDAQTLIPRLNGITHKDLTLAFETARKRILASVNGAPSKLDSEAVALVTNQCQDRTTAPALYLNSSALPIEALAYQIAEEPSPAAGVNPVFDTETRIKIEKAWLQTTLSDTSLQESIPNLKLELLFPWRRD